MKPIDACPAIASREKASQAVCALFAHPSCTAFEIGTDMYGNWSRAALFISSDIKSLWHKCRLSYVKH
jgi:hypothetical protein